MRHQGSQLLATPRLTLRPLCPQDAPAMFEGWANDAQVTRFLRWQPHKDWLETAQLLAAWQALYQNPDYYQWGIVLNGTGQLAGSISLQLAEEQDPAAWHTPGLDFSGGVWEPGYCLGRAFWGRGYATEALAALRDFWFGPVGGAWLGCCHAVQNPASGRVMQKAGWRFDHDAVYHRFDGSPVDCKVYYIKNEPMG